MSCAVIGRSPVLALYAGTRPNVGRKPATPQHSAGWRIEPPKSVPCASVQIPVATATAAPPLEPPQVTPSFQGLTVAPKSSLSVYQRHENSGALVRPMMMAPARRRLAMEGLSSCAIKSRYAITPPLVAQPF